MKHYVIELEIYKGNEGQPRDVVTIPSLCE